MDDSDDREAFSHCNQEIFQATQANTLKCLKNADKVTMEFDEPSNEHSTVQHEDSSKPADNFPFPKVLDTAESNESSQSLFSENAFLMTDHSNSDANEFNLAEGRAVVKRMLQFDSLDVENSDRNDAPTKGAREEICGSKINSNKKSSSSKRNEVKMKARKRRVKDTFEDEAQKSSRLNKRRSDKERAASLQQLHAESQRLLRETHNAAFKPTRLVHKPISSVLENIRKRKFELSRNCGCITNNGNPENAETPDSCAEMDCGDREMKEAGMSKTCMKDDVQAIHARESDELLLQSNEDAASKMGLDDGSELPFQMQDASDGHFTEHHDSPQEVLAPSRLAMNLKLGCAVDNSHDDGDEEEDDYDDDKENIAPFHGKQSHSSHMGDPVKAFVDDEAEEEDDSDDDPFGSEDSEEDDKGDAEELVDLIETGYVEKPIDNERRNQLHQQWLEQQDAAGTEDLLQRLKCGLEHRDPKLYEDGGEDSLGGDSNDNEEENMVKSGTARLNSLKLKQMIQQPFNEKDDVFLSDDEETEKKLEKQRVLEKIEDASFISPVEDENSREVFGLIKKLNIVSVVKKKAKSSSFFETMLSGSTSNSSKSSFLGRSSSLSMPSSRKQSSSAVRSFVFGRDDSNSRDAVSASEDSTDTLQTEERPVRHASAKFHSSSRSNSISQKGSMSVESNSTVSLLDVLRRSSIQSMDQSLDSSGSLSEDIFLAFKSTRNSVKVNRRL